MNSSPSSEPDHTQPGGSPVEGYLPIKLTPPHLPPSLVERGRLFDALDSAVSGPLTMLVGPAGVGKTAAVSSWLASGRVRLPVAWLSLDAGDNSRSRFWRLLLAALETAGDEARGVAARLTVVSDNTVDAVLPALVRMLHELSRPILLVLDDFDEITDPAVLADMELLLRAPPPALRMIVTARRVPALRLQRLRLAGTVTEIDPRELTFTEEEAALLLEKAGAQLSEQELHLLWERTEGWAAGLRLTAMALRGRTDAGAFVAQFAGDEAPVADYLLEEILATQRPEVRAFLLRTSITDTICGDLADALTDVTGGGATLSELRQDGVMVAALDDHREWFRYHGLLRGLLRSVLRREDPLLVPELHRRAAVWLAAHGREPQAARHAAASGDWELLADVVAQAGFPMLVRGELSELADVLRPLPQAVLRANPSYPLAIAGGALEAGDGRAAEMWLALADESTANVRDRDREVYVIGRAIIGMYRARLTGDVAQGVEEALVLMGGDRTGGIADYGYALDLRALALINLGALELWTGNLQDAQRDLVEGTQAAQTRELEYLELYGRAHLAVYHLWMGDTPRAEAEANAAMEFADRRGWRGTPRAGVALGVQGITAMIRADFERADVCLAAAARSVARSIERPLRAHITANSARLLRVQGRHAEALQAIAEVRADLGDGPFWAPLANAVEAHEALALHGIGRTDEAVAKLSRALSQAGPPPQEIAVALARIRLDQGRLREGLDLLTLPEDGQASLLVSSRLGSVVLRAIILAQLGEREAAADALEESLSIAEPLDCRLPFVVHGDELLDLLTDHIRGRSAPRGFAGVLVGTVAAGPRRGSATNDPGAPPKLGVEDLSDREISVLRYLPTMMSNREIADELFVSVNTVKTHLKQIYRKLDAHDRREAVTRARRAGLLAPPATR